MLRHVVVLLSSVVLACEGTVAGGPSCVDATACEAAGPCTTGITACATPTAEPTCAVAGAKPDGTPCGEGQVCLSGACVRACVAGEACQPANPCTMGITACATPTAEPTCAVAGAKPDGSTCGERQVCVAGTCVEACIAGQSCTPADPCGLLGVTMCSAPGGPATCSATVLAPDGTPCTGANGAGTCRQGECRPHLPLDEGLVTIAFDDGMDSQLLALPALERYGFHATFFVITGFVGGTGYLTLSDLRALASKGHEIASHSVDHPRLSTLSDSAVWSELSDSRTWLVTNVSLDAGQTFACPFGDYDERVVAASRELYRAHRTGETRFNYGDTDPALLGEVVATGTVAQLETYVDRAVAERSWLILGFHKLTTDANPGEYSYNVDDFASLLEYLSSRRVRVVPVLEGVGYLSAPSP